MKKYRILYSTILFIALFLTAWAFWYEPASLQTREHHITVPGWPKACDKQRIAILADLHVGSPYKGLDSLRQLVQDTNAAKPDLILLPGDFVIQGVVGGEFVTPEKAAQVLAELKAPLGVYAVMGNHDWWLGPKYVQRAFEQHGIPMVEDRSLVLSEGDCKLQLVGISDYWEGPHNVKKALQDTTPDSPILAFTHNPDIFPELPDNILLTIAGHTHGGQVKLPGIGRPVVPSNYGERYAIGHIIEGDKHLFVSSGVGTSILPVRFMVPPEITLLVVSADD